MSVRIQSHTFKCTLNDSSLTAESYKNGIFLIEASNTAWGSLSPILNKLCLEGEGLSMLREEASTYLRRNSTDEYLVQHGCVSSLLMNDNLSTADNENLLRVKRIPRGSTNTGRYHSTCRQQKHTTNDLSTPQTSTKSRKDCYIFSSNNLTWRKRSRLTCYPVYGNGGFV